MIEFIRTAWQGKARLWAVFWGAGVGLTFVGAFCAAVVGDVLAWPLWWFALCGVFLVAYEVWLLVSIWRCAPNARRPWGTLARAWVFLAVLSIPVRALLLLPQYRTQAPRVAAQQHLQR